MKSRWKLLAVAIALTILGIRFGIYSLDESSVAFSKQNVPFFVLKSSEADILSSSFVSSLAVGSSKDSKNVFLYRQDTQDVTMIDEQRKAEKVKAVLPSAKALAVNSQGRIFVAGDSELSISDAKGNRIINFPIPTATTSLAPLDNGDIAVASPDSDGLLAVFDAAGKLTRRIGNLKRLDKSNAAQNRFLNAGKVAVSQSGEIYYVSMFSPNPSVQKFSKQGELLKEFAIEGAAVELQLKRAKEFLREKKMDCTGGFYVIRSASVDPITGHLWIGMNGLSEKGLFRSESGVFYEYNSEGEKLAEYALEIGKPNLLTDVEEIAVKFPYVYVLTSLGQVYRFNLDQRSQVVPKESERKDSLFVSFFRTAWSLAFSPTVSAQPGSCPQAISYACSYPCAQGSSPITADCGTELRASLQQGEVIIDGNCRAGNSVGNYGGCQGSITGCRANGVRVNYSTTINCNPAPTPTPTPTPEYTPTPPGSCGSACYDIVGCLRCSDDGCYCTEINPHSPIVIDINGDGFSLTNLSGGVRFDLDVRGRHGRTAWTAANSDDAFLVLDRNGNGTIDDGRELFGDLTPQPASAEPHGFLALAEFDKAANGGNGDGKISSADTIYSSLRLWQDANHNGISESNELNTLSSLGVNSIELDYRESRRTDEHGNEFRYRAKIRDAQGAHVNRWAWDVFFKNMP